MDGMVRHSRVQYYTTYLYIFIEYKIRVLGRRAGEGKTNILFAHTFVVAFYEERERKREAKQRDRER